jgi:hypothetical protein
VDEKHEFNIEVEIIDNSTMNKTFRSSNGTGLATIGSRNHKRMRTTTQQNFHRSFLTADATYGLSQELESRNLNAPSRNTANRTMIRLVNK